MYYGRYLGFDQPPHFWGGFAEYVYVDLDMLPGTKIYKLPDDMPLRLGSLSEPLTSCIRAFNRAARAGGFKWGDAVVIQGSGPIGILAVAAAQEMGAGRVVCVGAPENPRLRLARKFGAEATVDIDEITSSRERVARVREIVGGSCRGRSPALWSRPGISGFGGWPAARSRDRSRLEKSKISDRVAHGMKLPRRAAIRSFRLTASCGLLITPR